MSEQKPSKNFKPSIKLERILKQLESVLVFEKKKKPEQKSEEKKTKP